MSPIFVFSDEYKRTVNEGTRSCAEFVLLVMEDWIPDWIRYMFGQFSGFSPSNRSTHVGIDKRLFSNVPAWGIPRRIGGRDDIEFRGRIGDFFTFLACYLFYTREFLFLCYIRARHEANTCRRILSHKAASEVTRPE